MASILSLYNGALAELGQRELQSLTEPVQTRWVLDNLWNSGFIKRVLEQGIWNFALRTVQMTSEPVGPAFGYEYRFQKPTDWVRTHKISTSEKFAAPLNAYADEGGYWYADVDPLYIQFVSNHPSYGANLSAWPESFTRAVTLHLALLAAPRILPQAQALALLRGPQGLIARSRGEMKDAESKDASNQPVEHSPMSSWARSRTADYIVDRRGSRLIG